MAWLSQRMWHCHDRTHMAQVCSTTCRISCSWFCHRGNGKRRRNGLLCAHGWCELRETLGWIPSWCQSHSPWCQRICAGELQTRAYLDHTLLLYGSVDVTDFLLSPSCSHFPVSRSRSPARVKSWKMGQTTALPPRTEEQLNRLEAAWGWTALCKNHAAESQTPAHIPALGMSAMSCTAWMAGGGCAGCRALLGLTVIYVCFQVHGSFPSPIQTRALRYSHKRLKFLHIFWNYQPCWERSMGSAVCFVLTGILHRYVCFLSVSY